MTISKRIVSLRETKGWSQRELARRVNLNVSVMNRIELGDRPVKDHELARLANVLDTTTDFLLGLSNKPKTSSNEQIQYDSLTEINKIIEELGIENIGFFDIEKWKNLNPEDVEEIRKHFEWVAHKAKERLQDDK